MMIPSYTPDKEMELLEEEREAISLSLNSAKQELQDLNDKICVSRDTIFDLDESIESNRQLFEITTNGLEERKKELENIISEINKRNIELVEVSKSLEEHKNDIDNIKKNNIKIIKEFQNSFEKESESKNKELLEISSKIKIKESEYTTLINNISGIINTNNDLDKKITSLKLEIKDLNKKKEEIINISNILNNKNSELDKININIKLSTQKLNEVKLLIKDSLREKNK